MDVVVVDLCAREQLDVSRLVLAYWFELLTRLRLFQTGVLFGFN